MVMSVHPASPYRVPADGSFRIADAPSRAEQPLSKQDATRELKALRKRLRRLQRVFAADGRYALLIVLQGMDASGKDSAVRSVMNGVNPAGCQVWSFKAPSDDERAHDFLWRSARLLPGCGMIGIFNRSYYEEVLVTRVHPELLDAQCLGRARHSTRLWEERYTSIRDHEAHLARTGTIILKFWLNLSRDEQRRRFLRRMRRPDKHWKFSPADIRERRHWDAYMDAYEAALNATSREYAPWYAIPADDKRYARLCIARTIVETLEALDLRHPQLPAEQAAEMARMRELMESGGDP
jgi:PPK2 family polyphosphate:nucleotide phosphotransferase